MFNCKSVCFNDFRILDISCIFLFVIGVNDVKSGPNGLIIRLRFIFTKFQPVSSNLDPFRTLFHKHVVICYAYSQFVSELLKHMILQKKCMAQFHAGWSYSYTEISVLAPFCAERRFA